MEENKDWVSLGIAGGAECWSSPLTSYLGFGPSCLTKEVADPLLVHKAEARLCQGDAKRNQPLPQPVVLCREEQLFLAGCEGSEGWGAQETPDPDRAHSPCSWHSPRRSTRLQS